MTVVLSDPEDHALFAAFYRNRQRPREDGGTNEQWAAYRVPVNEVTPDGIDWAAGQPTVLYKQGDEWFWAWEWRYGQEWR
jgi:hypothetical protein